MIVISTLDNSKSNDNKVKMKFIWTDSNFILALLSEIIELIMNFILTSLLIEIIILITNFILALLIEIIELIINLLLIEI